MSAIAMSAQDRAARLPRPAVMALASLAALFTLWLAAHLLRPQFDRPLTALRIDGDLHRLSAAQVAEAASLPDGAHVFAVDLDAVRVRVEALPWVAHARVTRVWPQRLAIRVRERVPIARWGGTGLLDAESRLFVPLAMDRPQELPQLEGPAGREADVWTAFRMLETALEGSRFRPAGLSLDARGEWTATTVDGITLRFGDDEPATHAAMLRGAVTQALTPWLDQVAGIDLHYANGFSTAWKGGVAPFAKTAKGGRTPPAAPATPPAAGTPAAKEPL